MITEFSIGTSHTINLGNYESTKIEASVTFAVSDTSDFATLKDDAQQALRDLLEATWRAQQRRGKTDG